MRPMPPTTIKPNTATEESESAMPTEEDSAAVTSSSVASMAEDLQRSADSAIRSARKFQNNLPEYMDKALSDFTTYEHHFFRKIKEGLFIAAENPASAVGVGLAAALLFLPGPRSFLFRQTLGRFQSEESKFVRAKKNVEQLKLSVELMKKEREKLLQRASLAERDMNVGRTELMNVARQVHSQSKSLCKFKAQAADLMDGLREIPSGAALKLRTEVASMTSDLEKQKAKMDKCTRKISELGLPV